MRIMINGVRLFVDIEGAGLVADGTAMREKPTLILLHGGPGADHSIYKPGFSALSDLAQIAYYDHRGCGRSEDGPREHWTLAQWADDLKALCDTLGIDKPIVLGTSFGGFVAQAYATRYPDHPGKLILISTAAKVEFSEVYGAFARLGGPEAGAIAQAYWSNPLPETRAPYLERCLPLYRTQRRDPPEWTRRAILRNEAGQWFNGPSNEHGRMDFREALGRIKCPVLIMAGDKDPITPIVFAEEIAQRLPAGLVRFERFADCGHGIVEDDPERYYQVIRDFILTAA